MRDVFVHPRVIDRHPELDEESVLFAWRNAIRFARRDRDDGTCYVAVGIDGKGGGSSSWLRCAVMMGFSSIMR